MTSRSIRLIFRSRALLFAVSVLILSCSPNDPEPDSTDTTPQVNDDLETVESVLENADSLLQTALAAADDTVAALTGIVDKLNADTLVDTAIASEQGIAIQYENGMRSGIFLSPMDDSVEGVEFPVLDLPLEKRAAAANDGTLPKQAVLWNVHYNERKEQANRIATAYGLYLPKAGYSFTKKFGTIYLNDLCSLSTKDYIHLYSHGWAWPRSSAITDVYLMTNEVVTNATSAQFTDDIKAGRIVIAQYKKSKIYFVNSDFITRHNTFKKEAMVYGGFCYSFLGKWADALPAAGASVYMGFSWAVYTDFNAYMSISLASKMADTALPKPVALGYWYDTAEAGKKFYYNPEAKKNVTLHYTGSSLYSLWNRIRIDSLAPERGGSGTLVTVRGTGFGAAQEIAAVSFGGANGTVENWSDSVITVTVPPSASSGLVVVKRGDAESNGVRFSIGGPFISKLTPDTSHANDSIVITGEKFGKAGKVLFDTIEANVIGARWDSTRIPVWVPVNAVTGKLRVLVRREGEYGKYDTSNAVSYTIAVPKPVITSVKPSFALPDSFNYLKVSGTWWKRSPNPNASVTIAGSAVAFDYWTNNPLTIRCNPAIPLGMQQLILTDDSVKSEPFDVYFGIPIDTIIKTARYARCQFGVLAQCVSPKGNATSMAITPGTSVTFSPVTWNDRTFSFDYSSPGSDIKVSVTGKIGPYGTTVASITADYTRTNGDHAVISLAAQKEMPLEPYYHNNFTSQFSSSNGFLPPPYSIPRDSVPGFLTVSGTLNAMEETYTIESVNNEGIPSFSLEFKKTVE